MRPTALASKNERRRTVTERSLLPVRAPAARGAGAAQPDGHRAGGAAVAASLARRHHAAAVRPGGVAGTPRRARAPAAGEPDPPSRRAGGARRVAIAGGAAGVVSRSGVVPQAFARRIVVPGLGERRDEIGPLAKYLVGSVVPTVDIHDSGIRALEVLDYSEGNIDRLRVLLEAAALTATNGRIDAEGVGAALASEARTAIRQMFFQGQTITAGDVEEWLQQFPTDIRATAAELVIACRRRYYCDPSQWWSHLRHLFAELLREFDNESELRDRIVLTSFQRPGKSEGRALADFTKAAALRQGTPRVHVSALGRAGGMPASPIILFVDDWVGSGEQIGTLLQQHRSKFTALAKDVSVEASTSHFACCS